MDMVVKVPALRGRMGGRTYFTVSMKLKTVPRFVDFQNYKDLEPEKWVRVGTWGGREEALAVITDAIERAKAAKAAELAAE